MRLNPKSLVISFAFFRNLLFVIIILFWYSFYFKCFRFSPLFPRTALGGTSISSSIFHRYDANVLYAMKQRILRPSIDWHCEAGFYWFLGKILCHWFFVIMFKFFVNILVNNCVIETYRFRFRPCSHVLHWGAQVSHRQFFIATTQMFWTLWRRETIQKSSCIRFTLWIRLLFRFR
jgi:hypothetical protein